MHFTYIIYLLFLHHTYFKTYLLYTVSTHYCEGWKGVMGCLEAHFYIHRQQYLTLTTRKYDITQVIRNFNLCTHRSHNKVPKRHKQT